jgi:hypothetical protein
LLRLVKISVHNVARCAQLFLRSSPGFSTIAEQRPQWQRGVALAAMRRARERVVDSLRPAGYMTSIILRGLRASP